MAKKAVLIGCNYPGTDAELHGCVNDVTRIRRCLINRFGFEVDDITVLIDTDLSYRQPTGANIRRSIKRMIQSAESGDILYIHFSGHGTRLPAETGEDDDTGYDECIVPCDMNMITDDDFRDFVDRVPNGCRLTFVSDSCHSGGLIDDSEEQIGESYKYDDEEDDGEEEEEEEEGGGVGDGEGNEGGDEEVEGDGGAYAEEVADDYNGGAYIDEVADDYRDVEKDEGGGYSKGSHPKYRSRSLPISTLIEILKQKTGNEDIDVGKLRTTLFDMFGDDASPKIKKFMKVLLNKLQCDEDGFMSMIGSLTPELLEQKLEETEVVDDPREVYAGARKWSPPDNGILISGCQSNQTSADANPTGKEAYGALTNAILKIVAKTDNAGDKVTNWGLVTRVRKMLAKQGYSQRPGLYCSDRYVDAAFIC